MPAVKTPNPAAENREQKEREEKERWKRILAWYMMQKWETAKQAELRKYEKLPLEVIVRQYVHTARLADQLLVKTPGRRSAYELLEDMERFQESDSPFHNLLRTMRETPGSGEAVDAALADVIRDAPERIMQRERRRSAYAAAPGELNPAPVDPAQEARADRRLEYEMCFLRGVMPPELFRSLCGELARQGRRLDAERDFRYVPDAAQGDGYPEYVDRHRVMPVERDGKLANRDEVFTGAAYLLAAWEQRDAPAFDGKKADARAMELSASRAFHTYMQQQPGSLLAAARNVGLDFTHEALTALDAMFEKRDSSLRPARDALKKAAEGKSAAFHRTVNALDRFVEAEAEPPRDEQKALRNQLGEFVLRETSPQLAEGDRTTTLYALSALRALTGSREFAAALDTVNSRRPGEPPIRAEDLDALAAEPEAESQPEPGAERADGIMA